MLEAGALVGERYRVGRTLGKGGMGLVVEATHLQLGTHVAIKVLKGNADAANIERFLREARAAAKLRGEHICRVHDFGTLPDGAPYMVMELLHGQDLATVLKASGPVEAARLARYMLEVCEAIAEAHAAGIVHRDLKPSNLYVVERPDGVPMMKVLDFGIMKSMANVDFALTDTTNVMGSPAYMSPEQLRSSKTLDARSDIWSLGIVMHELVTGNHPFKGESLTELAIAIANDAIPPFPDTVPPALSAVIVKCLEKDAAKRYQNVGALAAALEPLAAPDASRANAVAFLLTGALRANTEASLTAPSLPSHLASPAVTSQLAGGGGLARAISEVAELSKKETTTLRGASGAVIAQTGVRPRRRFVVPLIAATGLVAVMLAIGVAQIEGDAESATSSTVSPATSPAPSPAPAPPPPPEPAPVAAPPEPAPVAAPVPATAVDAGVDPTETAAVEATTPANKPKKPKKGKRTTATPDLSKSRY